MAQISLDIDHSFGVSESNKAFFILPSLRAWLLGLGVGCCAALGELSPPYFHFLVCLGKLDGTQQSNLLDFGKEGSRTNITG